MFRLEIADNKERVFIVGDIHGDYDLLMEFIKWSKLGDNDLLVSVGDLIDRGEKNIECLTHFLFADNCRAVKGNHDQFMVEALLEKNRNAEVTWLMNGGEWVLDEDLNFMKGLAREVDKLPIFREIKFGDTNILVCHAECPYPSKTKLMQDYLLNRRIQANNIDPQDPEVLDRMIDLAKKKKLALWGRDKIYNRTGTPILGYDFVIHGHTVTQNLQPEPIPIQLANQHWIDTGSVFKGGRMTFMEIKKDGTFAYHQFWKDADGELCII